MFVKIALDKSFWTCESSKIPIKMSLDIKIISKFFTVVGKYNCKGEGWNNITL